MPLYEAKCNRCGAIEDYFASMANCRDTPLCCGHPMEKQLSAPSFIVDIPAYVSPVSGKVINSRAERREDMKRTDSRPWEGREQETKVAQERVKEEEKKADKVIEEAVAKTYYQMPTETRKALEAN